jgi:hypothetical protein
MEDLAAFARLIGALRPWLDDLVWSSQDSVDTLTSAE